MALSGMFASGRWVAPCCALALVACTATTSRVRVRTDGRLRVLPQEFTAAVGCGFASGDASELGYYVATLIDLGLSSDANPNDHTHARDAFPREAGSGVAARCTSTTTFSTEASGERSVVEIGHVYAAIVDGYAGLESPTISGSRRSGNWAAPAWQWLCGVGGLDETQLDWLIKRVQRLQTSAPSAPPSDSSGSDTSSFPPVIDAGDSSTLRSDGSSTSAGAPSTGGSSPAPTLDVHDAAVGAVDAGTVDAGTVDASTVDGDAGVGQTGLGAASSTTDSAFANQGSSSATLESNTGSLLGAGDGGVASDTNGNGGETSDTEPRDWRSELLAAAKGDFAPPPNVVRGGQSGVRGCVPLF